ncbi:hypothetical protein [Streptomyces yerevanensis]|uniref:hypothetical protein n=1 Tax=Streptomyces yerevanensis TaxID=66378 RepID=UPI000527D6E6|nr:hypothetical protein [Streptomyces yerevanensis]
MTLPLSEAAAARVRTAFGSAGTEADLPEHRTPHGPERQTSPRSDHQTPHRRRDQERHHVAVSE